MVVRELGSRCLVGTPERREIRRSRRPPGGLLEVMQVVRGLQQNTANDVMEWKISGVLLGLCPEEIQGF